ncbi:MAG: AgmX/PglI C-terminal domain-containing protein [Polyangiaceae bacterium]|nr:AgmX/PglI C-terminal domain-containing protein [Polyangiaceae bacterium]
MSFEESGILRRCHATLRGGSLLLAALALAGAGACEPTSRPARAPAAPAPAKVPTSQLAPEVASTIEAPAEAADGAPAGPAAPEPPAPDARLGLEDPYLAGAYVWPSDGRDRRALQAELARWNVGGLGAGKPWHPQPRVMISEPVVVRGRVDAGAMMRSLRAGRYGAVRRCYDQALQSEPELEGRTVLRLTVGRAGKVTRSGIGTGGVPDTRRFGKPMNSGAVRSCLARAFQGADAAPSKGPDASVVIAVDLWPGDVPLPVGSPGALTGKLDPPALRELVEAQRSELSACFRAAEERLEGVWGRVLLRVDVDADGKATAAGEHESTFPDRTASRCAADVLRQASWPTPQGGAARIMVPLRWGTPPPPATP